MSHRDTAWRFTARSASSSTQKQNKKGSSSPETTQLLHFFNPNFIKQSKHYFQESFLYLSNLWPTKKAKKQTEHEVKSKQRKRISQLALTRIFQQSSSCSCQGPWHGFLSRAERGSRVHALSRLYTLLCPSCLYSMYTFGKIVWKMENEIKLKVNLRAGLHILGFFFSTSQSLSTVH